MRRGIHAKHHRRQSAGRQSAQVGHRQVGNVAQRRVGIGAGLEVDLDEAHAGQRARFAVVDVGRESEEPLEGVGNVGFNLLRWHAVVKRRYNHHRHIDLWKEIDRHSNHGDSANERRPRGTSMMMKWGNLRANLGISAHLQFPLPSCRSFRPIAARFQTQEMS